jgi:hypothetical protein
MYWKECALVDYRADTCRHSDHGHEVLVLEAYLSLQASVQ